jgi:tellurite resistance-related uncharacterized protein
MHDPVSTTSPPRGDPRFSQGEHNQGERNPGERNKLDRMLDTALALTFPGSDPVAITISENRPAVRAAYAAAGERDAVPDDCPPYRRTSVFTQDTIPDGLLRAHRTASGVWALIHVIEGELIYRISGPAGSERVIGAADRPGVIEPERLHEVEPHGPVRFYVEFHRRA